MLSLIVAFYSFTIFLEDLVMAKLKLMQDSGEDQNMTAIMEGLRKYWDGVFVGVNSLFMSISGGEDWAGVGEAFALMGNILDLLFATVILMSSFLVLNVLVG